MMTKIVYSPAVLFAQRQQRQDFAWAQLRPYVSENKLAQEVPRCRLAGLYQATTDDEQKIPKERGSAENTTLRDDASSLLLMSD
jgi:hypothetical protein